MRKLLSVLLLILCWRALFAGDTLRFEPELVPGLHQIYHIPWSDIKHPRLGLALSGGGARGLAHIGVLQVLEEAGIEVDVIAGTSMGALVGGMYASGFTPTDIQTQLTQLNWQEFYFDTAERRWMFPGVRESASGHLFQLRFRNFIPYIPTAVSSGQRFLASLLDLTKRGIYQNYKSWDLLRVSFRCVTTDLVTGQRVVFDRGDMSEAIRASMSIPLLLSPVVWDTLLLVDGGLVENIPVETAREAGADYVIAVDVAAGMRNASELRHPWEIVDQISNFTIDPRNRELLEQADLVITPATEEWGSSDFTRMEEIVAEGRRATEAVLGHLQRDLLRLAASESDPTYAVDTLLYTGVQAITPPLLPQGIREISRQEIMALLNIIHQTGYYFREEALLYRNAQGRAILEFHLQENQQITGLSLHGVGSADSLRALQAFEPLLGRPANFSQGLGLLNDFIAGLRQEGYSLAAVDSIHFQDGITSIWVDRGQIESVEVTGNHRTSDYSILRDFKIKPGDYFNLYRAQSSIANIYGSDLYRSAYYRVKQQADRKQLEVIVQERPFPLLQVGLGYDDREFERMFFRLRHENSGGLGIRLLLYWRFASARETQRLRLEQDRLFHTTLTWRVEAENSYQRYSLWEGNDELGRASYRALDFSARVGQQIKRLGTISVGIRLTDGEYRWNGESRYYDLRRIMLSSLVDTRNRIPWPETGEYHLVEFETSSSLLNPSESFNRWRMLFDSYRRLYRHHIFHSTIHLAGADETTPEPYWWHEGYETGLWALHTRQLTGRLSARLGLQYYWIAIDSESHRLLLMTEVTGVGLWRSNSSNFNLRDDPHPQFAAGLILDTMLGPMEMIYAVAPAYREHARQQRLTFNFGFRF